MDDELIFLEDDPAPVAPIPVGVPWKILIVDDDEGVHTSTRFALERLTVDGRPLAIMDAYSAVEAREAFRQHPDTALALIDVVMESDHAGLEFVRWVREELGNRAVRLVLRTGQPGQAPEREVVIHYDIDDYKTKSDLTAQKLFTLLHASLRSYRLIRALERNQAGLRRIINAAADLYGASSMAEFGGGVLEQMTALLNLEPEAIYCEAGGVTACSRSNQMRIVAAAGEFSSLVGQNPTEALPDEVQAVLAEALASRGSVFRDHQCVCYFEARDGSSGLLYLVGARDLTPAEQELAELFARSAGVAFCGLLAHEAMAQTA